MVRIRWLPMYRLVASQAAQVLALGLVVYGIAEIVVIPFLFAGLGEDRRLLGLFLEAFFFKRLLFLRLAIVLCGGFGWNALGGFIWRLNRAVFAFDVLGTALLAPIVLGVPLVSRLVLNRIVGLMLKRKVTHSIKKWINSKNKKCLVIQGARQTGKTYIVERFAEENYEEIVEINFKQIPSAMDIFSGDLTVDNMVMAMRFRFPEKKIIPGKSLIFLDEIQECQEAITSLKFWALDNRFDVIASGSLLGIDYKRASSYPVGYVDYLKMYGIDFEEFLWGMGISEDMIMKLCSYLDLKAIIPEAIHSQMMKYFRQYIAIGGMPEAVQKYIDTRDFREVDRIQRSLLQGYQYDIAHYATAEEKVKAEKCYLSLAKQLLDKENHKFQYKEVEHGGRAQKYFSSIEWLLRADMVHLCKRVTDIRFDLDDYARDDFFRAYTTDLSLLMAMKDFSIKQHIIENTLIGNSKGGIFECAVADALYKKGYPLYFYKNETTKKEIDIIIQKDGKVIPIEVKSGNTRANSLKSIMKNNKDISFGYKFIDGNIGASKEGIITLPLYMVAFFDI